MTGFIMSVTTSLPVADVIACPDGKQAMLIADAVLLPKALTSAHAIGSGPAGSTTPEPTVAPQPVTADPSVQTFLNHSLQALPPPTTYKPTTAGLLSPFYIDVGCRGSMSTYAGKADCCVSMSSGRRCPLKEKIFTELGSQIFALHL
jgi:hypothetical protein